MARPHLRHARILAAGLALGIWLLPTAWAESPAPEATVGMRLFQEYCASCHGDEGKGNGPLTTRHNWWQIEAQDHSRRPRDLTRDWFQFGDSRDAIRRTIRNGSGGTAMTTFAPVLAASDVDALADVVLRLRGDMSNAVIQRRFPDRIPTSPAQPHYHHVP